MADKTIRVYDQKTQTYVDVRYVDNGDGSHSVGTSGSGGGGGGAVTIADGANAAQGTTSDASSANTLVGLLKAVKANTGALPVVGQAAMAASTPVVIANNQSSIPVSPAASADLQSVGSLTAAQATAGTPVAGGTVDTTGNSGFGESTVHFSLGCSLGQTFQASSVIQFEYSMDGTLWLPLIVYQDGVTTDFGKNSYTGTAVAAGSAVCFYAPAMGRALFRARASTLTASDVISVIIRMTYGTGFIPGPVLAYGTGKLVNFIPAVTTGSAYTAGNNVGGLLTVAGQRVTNGTALLDHLSVFDHSAQAAPLDILFFNNTPAATFTNKAAFPTLSNADLTLCIGRVSIAAGDYVTVGGAGAATKPNLGIMLTATGGDANIRMAINTSGTPTWVGASDLTVRLGLTQN